MRDDRLYLLDDRPPAARRSVIEEAERRCPTQAISIGGIDTDNT